MEAEGIIPEGLGADVHDTVVDTGPMVENAGAIEEGATEDGVSTDVVVTEVPVDEVEAVGAMVESKEVEAVGVKEDVFCEEDSVVEEVLDIETEDDPSVVEEKLFSTIVEDSSFTGKDLFALFTGISVGFGS